MHIQLQIKFALKQYLDLSILMNIWMCELNSETLV